MTAAQVVKLEEVTRGQSSYITQSRKDHCFKFQGCHWTSLHSPSHSLIKRLCYPEAHKFTKKATKWSNKYYVVLYFPFIDGAVIMKRLPRMLIKNKPFLSTVIFSAQKLVFFIDVDQTYLVASPDSLINCSCCKDGHR